MDITARNLCWDQGVAMFVLVKVMSGFVGQEAKIFGAGGLLVTCNHTWDLPLQTHPHADYIRSTLKPGTLPSSRYCAPDASGGSGVGVRTLSQSHGPLAGTLSPAAPSYKRLGS